MPPLPAVPGGAANDAMSENTRAPKTLGAVGCLQCLLPYGGSCAAGHPTGHARPPGRRSRSALRNNQSITGGPLLVVGARAGRNPAEPDPSSRAIGRCHAATGLFDPVEGFCRFSGTQSLCGENTMNRLSLLSPPSFVVFVTVELFDTSAIRAFVKKNRPFQAGQCFATFRTDRVRTTRVRKFTRIWSTNERRRLRREGRRSPYRCTRPRSG